MGKDTDPLYEIMQAIWAEELEQDLREEDELRESIRREQEDYSDFA